MPKIKKILAVGTIIVDSLNKPSYVVVEPVGQNIKLRRIADDKIRFIPTEIINNLVTGLKNKLITFDQPWRVKKKKSNQLNPEKQDEVIEFEADINEVKVNVFDILKLDYESYILGYESTIQQLCKFVIRHQLSDNNFGAFEPTHLPKPFLLLAGISGTGKSRFVKEQARLSDPSLNNFCMLSVRPDWHEPSDLLGYVSRIPQPHYVVSEFLLFVVKAWKNAFGSADASKIVCKNPDQITPFWLCLDEMNLAPVEQYFADYLSVLETRQWDGADYSCDPLLKATAFNTLDHVTLRELLGLADPNFSGLWDYFKTVGIPIPPNLIVAGTVNMDETTHGFSRKVIDRALTIDFGAFFPNELEEYFAPTTTPIALSFPVLSRVNQDDLAGVVADNNGKKSIAFLESINDILGGTPFELAYRALNELLISVVCFKPKNELELHAVWDDFLMTKVLPRLEGDSQKLKHETANGTINNLLTQLKTFIEGEFKTATLPKRPDLLRVNMASKVAGELGAANAADPLNAADAVDVAQVLANDSTPIRIGWRSVSKLDWMDKRLQSNGFTSYWP